jgi:hypothetical protein
VDLGGHTNYSGAFAGVVFLIPLLKNRLGVVLVTTPGF